MLCKLLYVFIFGPYDWGFDSWVEHIENVEQRIYVM